MARVLRSNQENTSCILVLHCQTVATSSSNSRDERNWIADRQSCTTLHLHRPINSNHDHAWYSRNAGDGGAENGLLFTDPATEKTTTTIHGGGLANSEGGKPNLKQPAPPFMQVKNNRGGAPAVKGEAEGGDGSHLVASTGGVSYILSDLGLELK
ncbi:hypothetical protein A2U01_0030500, partial [Trifolium medium]|nr:hypothetical protein [Trifolium medium]